MKHKEREVMAVCKFRGSVTSKDPAYPVYVGQVFGDHENRIWTIEP